MYLFINVDTTFKDAGPTVEFICVFDHQLFDLQNSRNVYRKGFKAPLSLKNFKYWAHAFTDREKYI
jgi:hypothetical protein